MTILFDAEPLLAFSFDEPGAAAVERWLNRVYDGEHDGYVTAINLAEFRYIAIREASAEEADAHIAALQDMGLTEYPIDELWAPVSALKARYNPSLADAYAVVAARDLDEEEQTVTLLVGADDDYDVFETEDGYRHLIERVRDEPV